MKKISIMHKRRQIEIGGRTIRPHEIAILSCFGLLYLTVYMVFSSLILPIVILKGFSATLSKFLIFIAKILGFGAMVWKKPSIEEKLFLTLYDIVPGTNLIKTGFLIFGSFMLLYFVVDLRYDSMSNFLDFMGFLNTLWYVVNNDYMTLMGCLH